MRKTVSLSEAKVASRQDRAKKAVSVLRESFDQEVKISRELNESIWSKGIENPPSKVTVELENGMLYPAESFEDNTEQESNVTEVDETEEETPNQTQNQASADKRDYSEVVDETIGDVKDAVTEMEDPDYEALLEAEEAGKDRKTLKEWLENRD